MVEQDYRSSLDSLSDDLKAAVEEAIKKGSHCEAIIEHWRDALEEIRRVERIDGEITKKTFPRVADLIRKAADVEVNSKINYAVHSHTLSKKENVFSYIASGFSRPEGEVQPKIVSPPGSLARRILAFVFPKKTFELIFAQAIADMREEHATALADEDDYKAKWIVVRDHIGLGMTVVAFLAAGVGKKVAGIWKMIP